VLPIVWAVFVVCAVGGFLAIAAYWLDIQDRPDFSLRTRVGWSVAVFVFPVSIPVYAFFGGPGWPPFLKVVAFLPAVALTLFVGFVTGRFS
jgi:hypothetical protein